MRFTPAIAWGYCMSGQAELRRCVVVRAVTHFVLLLLLMLSSIVTVNC